MTADADGFHQGDRHIPWAEVLEIVAWKKDCYTVDQIRLTIRGQATLLEATESDSDLPALEAALSEHLPGATPMWYLSVALSPAFDPTVTPVFHRN